jgi:PKD repeat protein
MGVGYYQPLTQWSKGEYPGANNLEDDVSIIHSAGATLRADDYANTSSGAAVLGNTNGIIAQTGLIETRTDVDAFAFSTAGGVAQITVSPDTLSPNLDVQIKVTNANGTVVAAANPLDSFAATINVTLTAGQYFLLVDGVGAGDLTTGYSDYGSLGQYQVSGNFVPGGTTALPPSAIVSALPSIGNAPLTVQLNGGNSSDSDGTITAYKWTFGDGTTGSGSAISHIYQTAGNYTATLSVTDNSGLISSATQAVQVTQSPVSTSIKASSTTLTRIVSRTSSNCLAYVTLKYGASTVPSATVSGTWSGSFTSGTKTTTLSGTGKVLTNKSGVASFNSPAIPKTSQGTCTFTVTGATKTGYTYEGNGAITGSYSW